MDRNVEIALAALPAIIALIQLIQIIWQRWQSIRIKVAKSGQIGKSEQEVSSIVNRGSSVVNTKFYIVFLCMIIIVFFFLANYRMKDRMEGYEEMRRRHTVAELLEEIELIRAENTLILSKNLDEIIEEMR